MTAPLSPLGPHLYSIKAILMGQCLTTLLCTLGFLLWKDWVWGLSACLGGLTAFLPELVFYLVYFRQPPDGALHQTASPPAKKVVSKLFMGELLKWLLTLALFTVSFQWSKLKVLTLFIVFIATQLVFWLVPLIYEHSIRIYFTSSRASHGKNKARDL